MRIWGRCRACTEWFPCDDWFDQSVPTPCCPTCGLDPVALRYQLDQPRSTSPHPATEVWIG